MSTYTLFGQPAGVASFASDTAAYTFGIQFSVAADGASLAAIWFYSASGVSALPGEIALYAVSGQTLVHSEAATWSGAAGSGWVSASFTSSPFLTNGSSYKGCVLYGGGGNWYTSTANYWSTGAGSSGVTNGPLSASNNNNSDGGQDSFAIGTSLAYPSSSFNASNYWLDVEVAVTPISGAGLLMGSGAL